MPLRLKKGDRVVYRRGDATVEKSVGSRDYLIKLDSGRRLVVEGRKLTAFEVISVEAPDAQADIPEVPDNVEEPSVGASSEADALPEEEAEAESQSGEGEETSGEGEEDAPGPDAEPVEEREPVEEEQSGTGKPILAQKKFDGMSKKELYNLAQLYEVPGRSTLDIDGLRLALVPLLDLQ